MPDPLFESIDSHVFTSIPPRSFTVTEKPESAPPSQPTVEATTHETPTLESRALALLTNIQPSLPPAATPSSDRTPATNAPAISDSLTKPGISMIPAARSLAPVISEAPISAAQLGEHTSVIFVPHSVPPINAPTATLAGGLAVQSPTLVPMPLQRFAPPHVSATPTIPMPFAIAAVESIEPIPSSHPLSSRSRELTPESQVAVESTPVAVTYPPCSIPGDADPTAPTSRPPPPSDAELSDFQSVAPGALLRNSLPRNLLIPNSLPPDSVAALSQQPPSEAPPSSIPASLAPTSLAPATSVSETAPTSRPPSSVEVEVNPYLLLSSSAMSWTAIAESHGAAGGW